MLVDRGMALLRELHPDEWSAEETRGVTRFLQGGTCRFGRDPGLLPAQLGRRSRDAHHHGECLSGGLGDRCPMPLGEI